MRPQRTMRAAVCFFLILIASSCISNKRINYLQNLPDNEPIELDEFIPYAKVDYEYVLQPFDIVDIDFASSNAELMKAFEFQGTTTARGGTGGGMRSEERRVGKDGRRRGAR